MNYEIVLNNEYILNDLLQDISMEEELDSVAVRMSLTIKSHPDLPVITGGDELKVTGKLFNTTSYGEIFNGVIWDVDDAKKGLKNISIEAYDRSIYLAKSEDEYLFSKGKTASHRLKEYASDWEIPLGEISDTHIALAKSVYRAQPIYRMIQRDLSETSDKGGDLFIPRMNRNRLDLVPFGSNRDVWILEANEEVRNRKTLESAVTQVKVLGKEEEDKKTPVLATVSKDTEKFGTLQKILQDDKVKTKKDAEKAGNKQLAGIDQTTTVRGLDINVIRVGDLVEVDNAQQYVISVKRDLKASGFMTLEMGSLDHIRRKYYDQGSF
ncbi:XkdQ/YqbQ family protein [Halobacillus litoralis]|uniref:Phage portal protein n=1 Tax=Halobacillus litoralis TaxID=45668 RepID=A0A410MCA3_9BACI|nr:phage portal protein [Halobacillus litoralis]QAS52372.1 phage portal protein [Halobacillus litoralis]